MLICHEGPPRAGKSYEAVKTHIVPALRAGRKCYARLNGLEVEALAELAGITPERVRELLVRVSPDEVCELFTAKGDDPPVFKIEANSLVVIDEVHEFYVSARHALPKEQEAFFAKHGHIGLDVLVMTQSLGRLHSSVRQRIERKTMFAKLNALGQENKYVARYFAVGDVMGKFEKISSETFEYEPKYFPAYAGFQPEVTNTGAYTAGSKTVWQSIKKPAIFLSLACLIGLGAIVRFFMGGGTVAEAKPVPVAASQMPTDAIGPDSEQSTSRLANASTAMGVQEKRQAEVRTRKNLPPPIEYVRGLGESARPRWSGTIGDRDLLEWREGQGNAIERMTSDKLEAMGWTVVREVFGVVATFGDETIVFTAWPIDPVFSQNSSRSDLIRSASGPSLPSGSEEASGAAAASAPAAVSISAPPPFPGS